MCRVKEGQSLLAAGDDRGVQLLTGGLDAFGTLGATWPLAQLKKVFRSLGIPVPYPWRGGRPAYGADLSPREEEVAELVGRGYTNREIARSLCLSVRTVEDHVSSVLRKRGVRSRGALRAHSVKNP
jgi:DNA-binding CsgD family transcriptional regulator